MLGGAMTVVAASLSWLVLVVVGLVRAAGAEVPHAVAITAGLVAAPVALSGAAVALAAMWRGPPVVEFDRADSVACAPREAGFVRGLAQLRGSIGGAGFVHPRRLLVRAGAWLGAAAVGVEVLSRGADALLGAWPVAIAMAAGAIAVVFPPVPFWYRETQDGGAIVSPPAAGYALKRRGDGVAAAVARGEGTPAPAPRSMLAGPTTAASRDGGTAP